MILSKPILLDTGPLGMIAHPRPNPKIALWYKELLASGAYIYLPEIADYEVRRNFILENMNDSLQRLNGLKGTLTYLPLTTPVMIHAAQLWALARKSGRPTTGSKRLDGDVILAAQALSIDGLVVTDNVKHLSPFVEAKLWTDI